MLIFLFLLALWTAIFFIRLLCLHKSLDKLLERAKLRSNADQWWIREDLRGLERKISTPGCWAKARKIKHEIDDRD